MSTQEKLEQEKLEKAKLISVATGVPVGTIYRMARQNLLKTHRVGVKGGGVRFRVSEVFKALEQLGQTASATPKDAA